MSSPLLSQRPPLHPRRSGLAPTMTAQSPVAPRPATICPRILYRRSHNGDIPLSQQVRLPAPNLTPGFRLPTHVGERPQQLKWFDTGFLQLYFMVLVLYCVGGAVMAGATTTGCVKAAAQGAELGLVQVAVGVLWDLVRGQGVRHPRMDSGRCVRSVARAVVLRELTVRGLLVGW